MKYARSLLTKHNRKIIANRLFYIALLIELILMIVEKSALVFSLESYVFRITFVLTFFAVLIMEHENKEWAVIVFVWVFTFMCYRLTGKNDLLRYATFVMAARNINLGKTMKTMFYISLTGFGIIALLSLTGILGTVSLYMDYGREAGEELRYVFGFGHPNALWGCMYALMLLWIWVYGSKAKWWHFVLLSLANFGLYIITATRTSMMIGFFTIALAVLVRYIPCLSNRKAPFVVTGVITPCLCVAFSVWAAIESYIPRYYVDTDYELFMLKFDELLNNRIHNLYRADDKHSGAFVTWKLFSDHESVEFFDMGWVRLFYWYGIIPTALISILVVIFIYLCYKRKDAWTLIVVLSLSIYTVIEATFVSAYIGRNLILPVLGVYLGAMFERKNNTNVDKE
ncbi:MAG: hypothetical protein II842_10000 [Butyrivibrio sp.]|nr:hypothetical protein [Butyrivibrio sp.]